MRILNSLIVPKDLKEGPFGLFQHPFSCKTLKNQMSPWVHLKIFLKKSHKAEKGCGESLIAPKQIGKGDPSALQWFCISC